ncbi:MAG: oxidoreductase molybdopterin binding domain protein [Rhizobium sp.]|nr:oxidoreductase molybdopterin binding domain protein [Rhizobium sp.]
MRYLVRLSIFTLFFATFSSVSVALAGHVYFFIKSRKDENVQFAVTDTIIAKTGMVRMKAILPALDGMQHDVRGPLVRDLLRAAGVTGDFAYCYALDRYDVDIPVTDFENYDVIAAIEVDGRPIGIRERGPAWIVYPNADHPELQNNAVYESRSIWQLKELTVR